MKKRNTKQKQLIMDTLLEDKSHPTIHELYKKIISKESGIGQATVYRNIGQMVEEGKVRKIPTPNGLDRYDAFLDDHCHLSCQMCGKLFDLFDPELSKFISKLEKEHHVQINQHSILFEGICEECKKRSNHEEISL